MFEKQTLCKFLVKAKTATYASGDDTKNIKEENGSTTLIFEEGDFKYQDNYFGGEPYGGREIVFFQDKIVYIMVYYGKVNKELEDMKEVYGFLQKALTLIPEDKPYRGPKEYKENNLEYANNFEGEIDNFSGEETIKKDNQEIYKAKYIGGFVDQRR